MINVAVLVLNQNYEPLNVCNTKRAFVLVDRGKAEVLENGNGLLRSPSVSFSLPSVIRLVYQVRRPRPRVRLSRHEVFLRDNYTCQYCGIRTTDLTIDHIIPRNRDGQHIWENLVSACEACNRRKAGRTPQEAGMRLLRAPFRPNNSYRYLFQPYLETRDEWHKFIPAWEWDDRSR